MASTADNAAREEVRQAGLSADGPVPRLLTLLRTAEETHLDIAEAQRIAAEGGLAIGRAEIGDLMEAMVAHGLLGRVPTAGGVLLYDTIAHPHSHMLDEATATMVDLDVTPETLSAIVTRAIAEQPGRVEVLLRIRAPEKARDGPTKRGRPRRGA
ncbi:hypothetical protein KPL78_20620 [Roseomonas sp. HJA6]|uniref:Fur family transcriptional regulator n=1 Tax=Roseomonas alba TaxID=2846776 RepID=A0ABS7AEV4_9PROT|nr:hypothetical protein [Neoroseomonas alba]MBW6400277.1 hypothetical protein [Neoroseomonas alba]